MAILVRVTCSECGDVHTMSDLMTVRPALDNSHCTYFYRCPMCHLVSMREGDALILHMLRQAEVPEESENAEMREIHTGPVITYDDVIDFHNELEEGILQQAWFGDGQSTDSQ